MHGFLLGLMLAWGASAEIGIAPLTECVALDSESTEYFGAYQAKDLIPCLLFDIAEAEGCKKGLQAVNDALAKCQAAGKGPCKIDRCWENPQ